MVLLLLILGGFSYERIARAGDAERYPPPGELIDVDDHRLHLLCGGTGSPTVVLEAGLGESALGWASIQRELAAETRVCSYDRAGLAWSEPMTGRPTAERSAADLHALLESAGEEGPYVLVGHSIGAMIVRVFADEYRTDVSGLVLIDPTNDEAVIAAGDPTLPIVERRIQGLLAELGVVRLMGRSLVSDAVGGRPPSEVLDALPVLYGAASQATTVAELEGSVESARRVLQIETPGGWADLPVVVISAADSTPTDRAYHAELAALSERGRHAVAESGGHYVHYDQPDLVIDTVLSMVGSLFPQATRV